MTETALSRAIQDALQSLGAVVVRVQSGTAQGRHGGHMRLASTGTPDLWVTFRGWSGWLEVKTESGELSAEQAEWHRRAQQHGARVVVVRSVEQALRVVRRIGELRDLELR